MPSIITDKRDLAASHRYQYKERRFFDANETHAESTGRFNFGFFIPQIIDDLGISRTTIGLVNACMFWGFGLGDLVHGRLSDRFSSRLWVALGGVLTAIFDWLTSFGVSAATLLIPWAINGFVNAMCYSPGIRLIAQ